MKSLIVLMGFLSSTVAPAKNYYLLEPSKVVISLYNYETLHDPYLYPEDENILNGATFTTNLDVFKYKEYGLSWDNDLHFDQEKETGQIRHAGWHYKLGLTVLKFNGSARIQLTREHWSRHILERERSVHFPVFDRNGIELILIDRPTGRSK